MLKMKNAFIRDALTYTIIVAYKYYFTIIFCDKKYAKVISINVKFIV